ncbi:MAG: hypothetical protein ACRED4_09220 [Brevundimonas sp.]
MVRNPFAAYFVARALVLKRRGRYEEAVAYVRKAFGAYGADAPSTRAPVILNALYADLCETTDAPETAYDAARTVLIQINEINDGLRRGGPKKTENQWFILYWMRYVLSSLSPNVDSGAWELALAIPANYSSLDLPKTSSLLKEIFPFEQNWAVEFDLAVERARQDQSA